MKITPLLLKKTGWFSKKRERCEALCFFGLQGSKKQRVSWFSRFLKILPFFFSGLFFRGRPGWKRERRRSRPGPPHSPFTQAPLPWRLCAQARLARRHRSSPLSRRCLAERLCAQAQRRQAPPPMCLRAGAFAQAKQAPKTTQEDRHTHTRGQRPTRTDTGEGSARQPTPHEDRTRAGPKNPTPPPAQRQTTSHRETTSTTRIAQRPLRTQGASEGRTQPTTRTNPQKH